MDAPAKQDDEDTNVVKKPRSSINITKRPGAKFKIEIKVNLKPRPITPSTLTINRAIEKREKWLRDHRWDSVEVGRVLPVNVKYMVVDVETHDWKEGKNVRREGRVVEIAWKLFNDKESCLDSRQYLLKPHGYSLIATKAAQVHGITTERAINHGSDANLVFDEFTAILTTLPKDGFVIAHNMSHENSIFMCNLIDEQKIVWDNTPKCDTNAMGLWKYLPSPAREKYQKQKWRKHGMKLTELHGIVCTGPKSCASADFAHMADADVAMTWDIFKYYKQKIENPERSKKGQDASEVKLHESQKPEAEVSSHEVLKWEARKFRDWRGE
jgi:hypothetical protein